MKCVKANFSSHQRYNKHAEKTTIKIHGLRHRFEKWTSDNVPKVCSLCLSMLFSWTPLVQASLVDSISSENAILDSARIIPTSRRQSTNDSLLEFEKDTGWRIRILTAFQGEAVVTEDQIREAWKPDSKSVIIAFDPSSPNILAVRYVGDEVLMKLRRQFWTDLQSRFGNMFYIREQGEASAVSGVVESVQQCLRKPEGCAVVPGLPSNQYIATLIVSIAGGVILGFSAKAGAQGSITQRVSAVLLFSPLWLLLFVSLGIGPVVSRTTDKAPVIGNVGAFLATALVLQLLNIPPAWMQKDISSDNLSSDD